MAHVFAILSDPEKKNFYDRYGPEEEVRDRMHQQQQRYREEEDPFDIFAKMFFGDAGGGHFEFRNGQMFRRAQPRRREQEGPPPNRINHFFAQIMPLLVLFILYVVPYLFKTVSILIMKTPTYSFEKSNEFYMKKLTNNKAEYFVNDQFEEKYNFSKLTELEKRNLYNEIDTSYFHFLEEKCSRVMKAKQDIQYKLYYYKGYPRYVDAFTREMNNLDFSYCNKYNSFSKYVR